MDRFRRRTGVGLDKFVSKTYPYEFIVKSCTFLFFVMRDGEDFGMSVTAGLRFAAADLRIGRFEGMMNFLLILKNVVGQY